MSFMEVSGRFIMCFGTFQKDSKRLHRLSDELAGGFREGRDRFSEALHGVSMRVSERIKSFQSV